MPGQTLPITINRLDHIGIVVEDLDQAKERYGDWYGFTKVTDMVFDPVQKVRLVFVETGPGPRLELIEAVGEDSPVLKYAQTGGGLHHLCYEVDQLEDALSGMRAKGALIVCPPVPAVALQNRRIAFIYTRDKQLIEFLEAA
ncbi:MAG: VOC family protein [Rhodospirillales bacterium]|jgi:methylmalonyl-CoA/ethylmalonyl-CoA epimerase|nr:VOC family protein [Rhodospirillales bacterium]